MDISDVFGDAHRDMHLSEDCMLLRFPGDIWLLSEGTVCISAECVTRRLSVNILPRFQNFKPHRLSSRVRTSCYARAVELWSSLYPAQPLFRHCCSHSLRTYIILMYISLLEKYTAIVIFYSIFWFSVLNNTVSTLNVINPLQKSLTTREMRV